MSVRYDDEAVHDLPLADVRIEHFENSVPWRTFRSYRGQRHYSGSYASVTMDKFVIYESRLELARLMLADFDSEIVRIYAQPMRIGARVEGRARWHVPDFLLVERAGTARHLVVLPGHRSLRAAATDLGIRSGTLYDQLEHIERTVGFTVITRSRPVSATTASQALIAEAQHLLSLLDDRRIDDRLPSPDANP